MWAEGEASSGRYSGVGEVRRRGGADGSRKEELGIWKTEEEENSGKDSTCGRRRAKFYSPRSGLGESNLPRTESGIGPGVLYDLHSLCCLLVWTGPGPSVAGASWSPWAQTCCDPHRGTPQSDWINPPESGGGAVHLESHTFRNQTLTGDIVHLVILKDQ